MDETLFIKNFFGLFLGLWTVVLLFIAFKFFYKYLKMEKNCTAETFGTVAGYEWINRGGGVHLPIVNYVVDDKEYKTVGPRYKWYKMVKTKKPLTLNTTQKFTTDIYADTFEQKITGSGFIVENPMQQLFPVDSTIPVFYDSNDPALSYVLRYSGQKWLFWLLLSVGIMALILNIILQLVL